jgi:hypothetical protein
MLAAFTQTPELLLTEEESKKLAAGITRVVELYDVPMLDERSRAWIGLGLVGVEVYGTRIAAAAIKSKRRPHVVTPMRQQPPSVHNTPPPPPPPPITINQPFAGATL